MLKNIALMKDYYISRKDPYNSNEEEDISGKVVLLTGADSGLGKQTALEMGKRGARVVMACVEMERAKNVLVELKEKTGNPNFDLLEIDLGDLASIRKCAKTIQEKYNHIDILVNNGGICKPDGEYWKTKDGFEVHMGINFLGHALLTMLLLELLKKGAPSRIVFIASTNHQLAELDLDDFFSEKKGLKFGHIAFGNYFGGYANSKLAIMYFANALAKKLEGTGVTVYSLCPGPTLTNMTYNPNADFLTRMMATFGGWFINKPEQGVKTILYCSFSKKCAQESGKMYRFNTEWTGRPQLLMKDEEKKKRIWKMSLNLVGVDESSS